MEYSYWYWYFWHLWFFIIYYHQCQRCILLAWMLNICQRGDYRHLDCVAVWKCWRVFNYPNENMTYLGAANSHFQHIILDIGPTIRLDPSSTLGSARPRRVDLRFNWYRTSAKCIPESIYCRWKPLIYPNGSWKDMDLY